MPCRMDLRISLKKRLGMMVRNEELELMLAAVTPVEFADGSWASGRMRRRLGCWGGSRISGRWR